MSSVIETSGTNKPTDTELSDRLKAAQLRELAQLASSAIGEVKAAQLQSLAEELAEAIACVIRSRRGDEFDIHNFQDALVKVDGVRQALLYEVERLEEQAAAS